MCCGCADPATLFGLRTAFDELRPDKDAHVFASEYAVTSGGGRGNLIVSILASDRYMRQQHVSLPYSAAGCAYDKAGIQVSGGGNGATCCHSRAAGLL